MFDCHTGENEIPAKASRQEPAQKRNNVFASRSAERRLRIEIEVMRKPWLFCGRGRKLSVS
jgi:hypothetical protein